MKQRNTKQKELILDILKTKNHPTIKELYLDIKKYDSKIGQATVYRNINRLYQEDKIAKISVAGIDHYDMDKKEHLHLFCKKCQKIYDLYDDDYFLVARKLEKENRIKIERQSIILEGICEGCNHGERRK